MRAAPRHRMCTPRSRPPPTLHPTSATQLGHVWCVHRSQRIGHLEESPGAGPPIEEAGGGRSRPSSQGGPGGATEPAGQGRPQAGRISRPRPPTSHTGTSEVRAPTPLPSRPSRPIRSPDRPPMRRAAPGRHDATPAARPETAMSTACTSSRSSMRTNPGRHHRWRRAAPPGPTPGRGWPRRSGQPAAARGRRRGGRG